MNLIYFFHLLEINLSVFHIFKDKFDYLSQKIPPCGTDKICEERKNETCPHTNILSHKLE